MFKFLKEKLKKAVSRISRKVEEESEVEKPIEEIIEEKKEEPKKEVKEKPKEKKKEEIKEEKPKKKKSIFTKIKEKVTTKTISEKQFESLFSELELVLLESNVAYQVIGKIKEDLKKDLTTKPIKRDKIQSTIKESLKESISDLLDVGGINLLKLIKEKQEKPYVIVFFGINGSGKTTTIAKIVKLLQDNDLSCVIAASDTFRAAAIQQLEEHGKKLNTRVIKHDYGADSAAVAFDAVKHAKAKGIDVVLVDTAGRMHSNVNLLDEMKKIVRVCKPDLKVFVGESITGNDCTEQAQKFNENIGINVIILTKADVDEKGGAAISISYVTNKPILYLCTGQNYDNLEEFSPDKMISSLGL